MFKAKLSKEAYGALSDEHKALYRAQDDFFVFAGVESVDGWGFSDERGLRTALESERTERKALERSVASYKVHGTPEEVTEKVHKLTTLGDISKLVPADRIAALEAQYAEKASKLVGEKDKRIKKFESEIERILRIGAAKSALAKVDPKAPGAALLVGPIVEQLAIGESDEGFYTYVKGAKGEERITQLSGGTGRMEPEELVKLMSGMPEYKAAFSGTGLSGSGGNGSDGSSTGGSGKGGEFVMRSGAMGAVSGDQLDKIASGEMAVRYE